MPGDYHITLDATQDPSLLSPEVLVQHLTGVLHEIQNTPENLPREVTVEMLAPDAEQFRELEKNLEKLNRVIQPRGFMDNIAHAAFRSMSGIQGTLHPIVFQRDEYEATRMHVSVDLTGLSREDIGRFADFMEKNAHRIPR